MLIYQETTMIINDNKTLLFQISFWDSENVNIFM